ncbi:WD40 repeat-containing protein [Phytophthora cinnamomi]|uniref:WD40 repeat-containing protein n=1 Tax=Phytophthora cinnamomi TaxID=4785 RepID=UPI00355A43C1|nr:WD40 repeat-containing protein [Phytophthora cinnamomi]
MASEAHLRAQYELLMKENKLLKTSVEKLDRENHDLKRSVLDSAHAPSSSTRAAAAEPFAIADLLAAPAPSAEAAAESSFRRAHGGPGALLGGKGELLFDAEGDGDARVLVHKSTLRAHGGAVYTAKFSPCGRLLASGSFDCKVMLWDVTAKFNQPQLAALARHAQLVIDVSWAEDSATLVSGSYDHSVKLWDVDKSQLVSSKEVDGLVQCVAFNTADTNQYFLGSSKCCLHMADARSDVCRTWTNDAMVNALHVAHDGMTVITGDSKGMLKTWDVRMDTCLEELSVLNDPARHAISHVHASPASDGGDDGRFLGVNSYDNVLRVYDRRSKLISSRSTRRGPGGSSDSGDNDQLQLVCSVTGHKNKNWPIKSSFFRGDGYKYKLALPPRGRLGGGLGGGSGSGSRRKLTDGDGEDFTDPSGERGSMDSSRETLLLATGSADRHIYLHEVTPSKHAADASAGAKGNGVGKHTQTLVQKIDAHNDRVYCVDFHPTEPILASASADCSIKIWLPRSGSSSVARLAKSKN